MELTKNLQEYIGKYVRFNMYGTHCAKIIGITGGQADLILEFPMIEMSFKYIPDKQNFEKVTSIQKKHEVWRVIHIKNLEEINEEEYKTHIFELMDECSTVATF